MIVIRIGIRSVVESEVVFLHDNSRGYVPEEVVKRYLKHRKGSYTVFIPRFIASSDNMARRVNLTDTLGCRQTYYPLGFELGMYNGLQAQNRHRKNT